MVISLVHVLILFAVAFLVSKPETPRLKKIFWSGFILKLVGGITLGLVYTYYYEVGDTLNFYADGVRFAEQARKDFGGYITFIGGNTLYDPWIGLSAEPRTIFISKIVSIFCLLTQDNYWIASLYFSALAFFGAWYLVKIIIQYQPELWLAAVLAFLFLPTTVFWSSGIIKESLSMAGLFFMAGVFIKVWTSQRVSMLEWIVVLLCCGLVWKLKYYFLVVFLPVIFTAWIMKQFILPRITFKKVYYELLVWLVIFIGPLYVVSLIRPNCYPGRFLEVIASNYEAFVAISAPEDLIVYPGLQPTAGSILKYIPRAVFSGLFRPFIWEAGTVFQFVSALENLVVLLLFLFALKSWRKIIQSPDRLLIFSMLVYIVLLAAFLALSTPNFGTLSRYRVGFISFFVLLIVADNPLVNRMQVWFARQTH